MQKGSNHLWSRLFKCLYSVLTVTFFTLNSALLAVRSVPFFHSIIFLLSHMKIREKYEYFHVSIKMSSFVLCGCAALYTKRTKLECFRRQSAISTSNGVRKYWKWLRNSSYVLIMG